MAQYGDQLSLTMQASGDLSSQQYHIVSGRLGAEVMCMGSYNLDPGLVGVLQDNNCSNGRFGRVAYVGLSKVVAGASASANALFTSNGSARAIATTGSRQQVIGRFLEAPGADGDVVTCLLFPSVIG